MANPHMTLADGGTININKAKDHKVKNGELTIQ